MASSGQADRFAVQDRVIRVETGAKGTVLEANGGLYVVAWDGLVIEACIWDDELAPLDVVTELGEVADG